MLIPIHIDSWNYVNTTQKDALWDCIKSRFNIEPHLKKTMLQNCGGLLRTFKSRLTKDYVPPFKDKPQLLKKPPQLYPYIKQHHWDAFVKEDYLLKLRNNQSRTGRAGYTGLAEKLIDSGKYTHDELDRCVLWNEAHMKEGAYKNDECEEMAASIDEFQKQRIDGTSDVPSDVDAITHFFGPEHPGRVRAAGKHITPTSFFRKPIARARVTKQKYEECLEENKRLKLTNASLEEKIPENQQVIYDYNIRDLNLLTHFFINVLA
ncbi:hypothetical protein MKW98_021338 [Papaver atlanticum]|uniref:Transposase n=1 Tax=Papaver atlanticum TaxID=357466 RepID=A0AAD4SRQ4_9MAGN|nr:hypothetical protein MKW98_021338 [Papaver atlanticum]